MEIKNSHGTEIRSIFGLKSANFTITKDDKITFRVIGYGHGVGLSQTGADALAKIGTKYNDILTHFYTNSAILTLE